MSDESKYIKNGMRQAVYCASYGLLTAFFINILLGTFVLAFKFPLHVALGVVGLYAWAFFAGGLAGKIAHRTGSKSFTIWIVGILLAWSSILAMACAAGSIEFFSELKSNNFGAAFFDYIFKLAAWSVIVGLIPALILGIVWARQMKKTLSADDF